MFTPDFIATVIGPTMSFIGHVIIAIVVVVVHHQVAAEHEIDRKVILSMHREQIIACIGILCITIGYIIKMVL